MEKKGGEADWSTGRGLAEWDPGCDQRGKGSVTAGDFPPASGPASDMKSSLTAPAAGDVTAPQHWSLKDQPGSQEPMTVNEGAIEAKLGLGGMVSQ